MQVGQSVNARHSNGKYYGAFVTRADVDDTYEVYFMEDGCTASQIKHDHIKLPLPSERSQTFPNWHTYHGQVFFDEGTKKGDALDDPDYELEAGEWVVDHVTEDNNFVCMRLGQPHDPKNNVVFDISYVMHQIRKYEEE